MLKKGIVIAALALLGAPALALGQAGGSLKAEMALVDSYTAFAGSQQNALALVNGLRNGSQVTLQPAGAACPGPAPKPPAPVPPGFPGGPVPSSSGALPPSATILPASFTPPTGVMGYGNVNIAMDLARQQLARAGFAKPTPVQLRASFMGGPVTTCAGVTTQLEGILALRAAGNEGWGRIAARLGLSVSEAAK